MGTQEIYAINFNGDFGKKLASDFYDKIVKGDQRKYLIPDERGALIVLEESNKLSLVGNDSGTNDLVKAHIEDLTGANLVLSGMKW